MHRHPHPILLCLLLVACESGPVSLGAMTDGGSPPPGAGSGGTSGTAGGSSGEGGAGGQGGSGGLPVAEACGPAVCVDGTACCSESCGLCTLTGQCHAIECKAATGDCDPGACRGPAPLAPSHMCDDGSLAGPVCERNDAGDCDWSIRDCPPPGTGTLCGTRGAGPCPEGEYCRHSPRARCGASDAPGSCTPMPSSCTADEHPVCGCDGTTYPSPCLAASQGVSVASTGKCAGEPGEDCGASGAKCGLGEYCARSSCDAPDAACEPKPEACDANFAPVCGCDGKTYGNACEAASAGVNVAKREACDEDEGGLCGGFAGAPCPKGQYCDYAEGDGCEVADGTGVCKPQPQACTLQYEPVCGCDGKTYGNPCAAAAAGVSVASTGECP